MEFSQISILLVVAGVFGLIARFLKQPLLIGYLFAGLFLGFTGLITDAEVFSGLGQIGVALLLFLLGLEMNIRELPSIGKVAILTGIGQITFTSIIGFLIASALGFGLLPAIYIAIALTFSSTIIMVKLLSEKKDLGSLYGRIAVGFLLVQDFVAVIILMFLAGLGEGGRSPGEYVVIVVKAFILFGLTWTLSKKVLPNLFERLVAHSQELLFIVSIAWALGVASFVAGPLGFTLEIGGFLAGLALSNMPEHLQIAARTRSLRDFFLTIFFLLLGTQLLVPGAIIGLLPSAVLLSAFVLIGNPIIVLIIMGFLGYKKRTSFLAGLTVAQISEFSFILMAMGQGLGHLDSSDTTLVILVGVITMTVSTYLILEADRIYLKIKKYLGVFERKKTKEAAFIMPRNLSGHVVLVGAHRSGKTLSAYFQRKNTDFLVVDFNPKVFDRLTAAKIPVIFGDINDVEIMEAASLDKARTVISTISNFTDNLTLLEHLRKIKPRQVSVFTAQSREDAIKLYESGATYVVVPQIVAGDFIRHLFEIPGMGKSRLGKMGKSHFNRLLFK
ncbi:MAG: cation:proton antiporter [Patescibacteria group bacterium]